MSVHALCSGELAGEAGANPQTLRYYERRGLLEPERSLGGHRKYSPPPSRRAATTSPRAPRSLSVRCRSRATRNLAPRSLRRYSARSTSVTGAHSLAL
jgi:hypothetical protein